MGAAVTLSEVQDKLRNITSICTLDQTRAIQQVLKMFHWFAGKQIRNCATLGGKLQKKQDIVYVNIVRFIRVIEDMFITFS